tara:strand:- start:80 stop:514 length:435 start_codon:yes stop_codon:yes gene_type:complete
MTLDKRRILSAAKHAQVFRPSQMKTKTLDFLEVFILQSQCRISELFLSLEQYLECDLTEQDRIEFWAVIQSLQTIQNDIGVLVALREQLESVNADFKKASSEVTQQTVELYLKQTNCDQDPTDEMRSKLEKLLSHNIEPEESHE